MSNVTIKVRIIYAGDFFGNAIGFNGSEYRCRFMGKVYKARTLNALKRGLTHLVLATL
jgi:hypothetical protein